MFFNTRLKKIEYIAVKIFINPMTRYSLDNKENPKFIRIMQIVFGVACIAIAVTWVIYMTMPGIETGYWIPTAFIFFFGMFQIYSGLGYAERYVQFDEERIILRQNSFKKGTLIGYDNIESISILPLSVEIRLKNGKPVVVSFGMGISGSIDTIKNAFIEIAGVKNIITDERSDLK